MFVLLAGTRARTIFFWVDPRATEIFLTTTFRIAGCVGSCLGRKLCVCMCAQASAFHIVGSCTLIVFLSIASTTYTDTDFIMKSFILGFVIFSRAILFQKEKTKQMLQEKAFSWTYLA